MRRSSVVLFALILAFLNAGCTESSRGKTFVGFLPSNGISREHFQNLIAQHKIVLDLDCGPESCFAMIKDSELKRADAIIAVDRAENPWHYLYISKKDEPETLKQWEESSEERKFNLTPENYRNSPELKSDALLRGVVREAFTCLSGLKWPKMPHLTAMTLWAMPYLGRDFKVHEGVRAKVWANYPGEPKPYTTLEVFAWDDGQKSWTNGAITMHMSHPLAK